MVQLPTPAGYPSCRALAINAQRRVVGICDAFDGGTRVTSVDVLWDASGIKQSPTHSLRR
jgi:hypothetical protein